MNFPEYGEDFRTAEALIRDMETMSGAGCADCHTPLCNHHLLISIVLGFKNAARCLECLGHILQRDPGPLLDSLHSYIRQRECYRIAWEWAGTTKGAVMDGIPSCLGNHTEDGVMSGTLSVRQRPDTAYPDSLDPNAEWDAGDMGCGDLVLELRTRLQSMKPGNILKLQARDPGAPEDLPAWCRLTGHKLLLAEHPYYWIRRKE